jgi:hypothetical protein
MKEKKPAIGFIGLLLIAAGICSIIVDVPLLSIIIIGVGAAVLAYALFTGNLKLFG